MLVVYAADGWSSDGGVASVVVVDVDPVLQGVVAVGFGQVGTGVGPFLGEGPVESFDFAVGLRPVGAGPDVFDPTEGGLEGLGSVTGPVVGHDRLDGDPVRGEELLGPLPEGGAGRPFDIGEGFDVAEPGVVIDRGVDMFIPSGLAAVLGPVVIFEPVDPPPAPVGIRATCLVSTWISSPGRLFS